MGSRRVTKDDRVVHMTKWSPEALPNFAMSPGLPMLTPPLEMGSGFPPSVASLVWLVLLLLGMTVTQTATTMAITMSRGMTIARARSHRPVRVLGRVKQEDRGWGRGLSGSLGDGRGGSGGGVKGSPFSANDM